MLERAEIRNPPGSLQGVSVLHNQVGRRVIVHFAHLNTAEPILYPDRLWGLLDGSLEHPHLNDRRDQSTFPNHPIPSTSYFRLQFFSLGAPYSPKQGSDWFNQRCHISPILSLTFSFARVMSAWQGNCDTPSCYACVQSIYSLTKK